MVRIALGLWLLAACGKVNEKDIDAAMGSADDAAMIDGAGPAIVTAFSAQGVPNFAAIGQQFVKVPYNAEIYDDESEFDITTSRFTAKAAGDYFVCAGLALNQTGFSFELELWINNQRKQSIGYGDEVARGCTTTRLAAGDYVEIFMYISNTSATANITQNFVWDWFTVARLPESTSVSALNGGVANVMNQTPTVIPYADEQRDEQNAYDGANGVYAAPANGDYFTCASIATGTSSFGELHAYKNGAPLVGFGRAIASAGGCRTERIVAGDMLDVRIYQGTGGTIQIAGNASWNWMQLYRIPAQLQVNSISSFAVPQASHTKVPYTSEGFDSPAQFDVGTSTFTAAAAGDYLVCASLAPEAPLYTTEIGVFKNGSQLMGLATGRVRHAGCSVVRLAMSDQLDIRAYQGSSTSGISVTADPFWNWLQISKIR